MLIPACLAKNCTFFNVSPIKLQQKADFITFGEEQANKNSCLYGLRSKAGGQNSCFVINFYKLCQKNRKSHKETIPLSP
jgi:hypothetical protein